MYALFYTGFYLEAREKNSLCVEGLVFKNDNCYNKKKVVVQILQFSRRTL